MSTGRTAPIRALADDDELAVPHIVADKADLFIAYATVPGYMYGLSYCIFWYFIAFQNDFGFYLPDTISTLVRSPSYKNIIMQYYF